METQIQFRKPRKDEVNIIVQMLADDLLGTKRERNESPLPEKYYDAFDAINKDPNNELIVAILDDKIVGVMQLTFIPSLTYQGGWRAQIEGVRVASGFRSKGIGYEMFRWAIDRAKKQGCHIVQLTTDKTRPDTIRFYENLGFSATHEGMKLHLGNYRERAPKYYKQ